MQLKKLIRYRIAVSLVKGNFGLLTLTHFVYIYEMALSPHDGNLTYLTIMRGVMMDGLHHEPQNGSIWC